jgi:hypothetical protein
MQGKSGQMKISHADPGQLGVWSGVYPIARPYF